VIIEIFSEFLQIIKFGILGKLKVTIVCLFKGIVHVMRLFNPYKSFDVSYQV